jgi:hypothetical protein
MNIRITNDPSPSEFKLYCMGLIHGKSVQTNATTPKIMNPAANASRKELLLHCESDGSDPSGGFDGGMHGFIFLAQQTLFSHSELDI